MKVQVRRGVFETNSSSTHSLQLNKQTLDEVRNDVVYTRFFITINYWESFKNQ